MSNHRNNRPIVTYHVSALVEQLEGHWQSLTLSETYYNIADVIKAVTQSAVSGSDIIIIKINRKEKRKSRT